MAGCSALNRRQRLTPCMPLCPCRPARSVSVLAMSRVPHSLGIDEARDSASGSFQMNGTRTKSAIVQRALEQEPMIAHEIAMVAGEHDHGVLIEAERFQPTKILPIASSTIVIMP